MLSIATLTRASAALLTAAALFAFLPPPVQAQNSSGSAAPPASATPAAGSSANDPIAGPIRKADTVKVVVAGAESLGGEFRVDADGNIFLPRLGQINVAGQKESDAAAQIGRQIEQKQLLKRASVAVSIIARKARTVTVNGAVSNQGLQVVKDNAVLSEVLESANPSSSADLTRVQISRGDQNLNVNYKKYRNGESNAADSNPVLQDGDRIYVYSAAPVEGSVRVNGEVKDPSKVIVPITTGITAGQVLQMAGGVTDYADRNGIFIARGSDRIPVPYDEILRHSPGKDIVLQDKDELNVPRLDKPHQVTVAGAVRDPKNESLLTRLTLLEAVAQAGGPQDGAQQDKVEVRRRDASGKITTMTYDLSKDNQAATELIDGDYVFVPYPKQRPRTDVGTIVGIVSGIAVILGTLAHH